MRPAKAEWSKTALGHSCRSLRLTLGVALSRSSLLHVNRAAIAPRAPGSGQLVAVNLEGNRARRALGIELERDRIFFPGTAADRKIAVRRTDHAGHGAFLLGQFEGHGNYFSVAILRAAFVVSCELGLGRRFLIFLRQCDA